MNAFRDHFSAQANGYAQSRPDYPEALFAWLAGEAPGAQLAVDVGCGNGQATRGLAAHFDRVIGADASDAQIALAQGPANVRFVVAPADALPVDDGRCDLVAAAQAAHWFDHDRFQAEVDRVLKPGGLLALWTYELVRVGPDIDPLIDELSHGTLGADWPPERAYVEHGYADLAAPTLRIERPWSPDELVAYVETWSSLQRYRRRTGDDPGPAFRDALEKAWGPTPRTASWTLRIRAGLKP